MKAIAVRSFFFFVIALCAAVARGADMITPEAVPEFETVTVERVIDGDTIEIKSDTLGVQKVRLLGINCPEWTKKKEPLGKEATEYTKAAVKKANNVVTLEADGEIYDRFNRRLSVVWLGDKAEGVSLNEQILREGLAVATLNYQYSDELKEKYRDATDYAHEKKLGLFSDHVRSGKLRKMAEASDPDEDGKLWVSNTGKIHKKGCKFYQKGNGYFTNDDNEELHCKLCFGDSNLGNDNVLAQAIGVNNEENSPFWVSNTGKIHCKGCRFYEKGEGQYIESVDGCEESFCGICMKRDLKKEKKGESEAGGE